MKVLFSAVILSLLAAVCFFIVYFLYQEVLTLVLGFTWLIIAVGNYRNLKKNRK